MNNNQKDLNCKIIKFLLEKGADINQKTLKDEIALDLIANHCNKQELKCLLENYNCKERRKTIPKLNIKRLGEDYFKTSKATDEDPTGFSEH